MTGVMTSRWGAILWLAAALAAFPAPAAPSVRCTGRPPVRVETPRVALSGLPAVLTVRASGPLPAEGMRVEARDAAHRLLAAGYLAPGGEVRLRVPAGARREGITVSAPGLYSEGVPVSLRVIPGWLTLIPPALAILLALLFRHVVPALLAGVWVGAWIGYGGAFSGLLRSLDTYVVGALTDPSHAAIVVFTLLLGGMVGVLSRSGGTRGLVNALAPYATNSKRGQLVTWILGILVFFDDYANTLLVGNTMRPVTDRLRISREKLAYIVDSTAAPVASIALISTWIGFEVSLIGDALRAAGVPGDAYSVFLRSIPYRFYPILALGFGLMVAWTGRDLGPMLRAERRAAAGKLLRDGAVPLADFDEPALRPPENRPHRWINAVAPVAVVLVVAFAAQWLTGKAALAAAGEPGGAAGLLVQGLRGAGTVFSAGDSSRALLYGAAAGCLTAIVMAGSQRILSVGEALAAWVQGLKSMMTAMVILTLAWAIGKVCMDLDTSGFVVSVLAGHLTPRLLPVLIFLAAALISFATGTSWGTMGILVPLAVPTAHGMATAAGYGAHDAHLILLGAVSSVLAGSIFGDHCSPISDTTVMSSMSSSCDHVDHVKTQLPYALLVAVVGMVLGDIPGAFGVPPWLSIAAALGVLWAVLALLGRKAER